jgi:hypothetical protein
MRRFFIFLLLLSAALPTPALSYMAGDSPPIVFVAAGSVSPDCMQVQGHTGYHDESLLVKNTCQTAIALTKLTIAPAKTGSSRSTHIYMRFAASGQTPDKNAEIQAAVKAAQDTARTDEPITSFSKKAARVFQDAYNFWMFLENVRMPQQHVPLKAAQNCNDRMPHPGNVCRTVIIPPGETLQIYLPLDEKFSIEGFDGLKISGALMLEKQVTR